MTDTFTDRAALEALVIDVEGADQDGAMVGWEYTATGMRFTIRGALAAALAAHLAAARTELEPDA
jgi:hypothetical protein